MQVTIIGADNMGRGIGTRALAGGHSVRLIDKDPAKAKNLATSYGSAWRETSLNPAPRL